MEETRRNTRHWLGAGLMQGWRRRRLPYIDEALSKRLLFYGEWDNMQDMSIRRAKFTMYPEGELSSNPVYKTPPISQISLFSKDFVSCYRIYGQIFHIYNFYIFVLWNFANHTLSLCGKYIYYYHYIWAYSYMYLLYMYYYTCIYHV